jgi:tetratricopeptide (TPR) repeat protein
MLLRPSLLIALALAAHGPGAAAAPSDPAYERSLAVVERALAARPGEPRLIEALGRVHFRRGRFEEAARVFEDGIARIPPARAGELLLALGACREKLGDLEGAAEVFRRAQASSDHGVSMRARLTLAIAAFERGDHADAIDGLRAAVEKGNRGAETLYQLGRALEARAKALAQTPAGRADAGRLEAEAVDALHQAIALDSGHAQAHYVLGQLLSRQGKREEGRRELEIYQRLRRPVAGIDVEKLARADNRFEAQTAADVGRVLLDLGDGAGALAHAELALQVEADSVEGLALLASAHRRAERAAEAAGVYARILQLDPDHAEALWNLGLIELRAGRIEEGAARVLRSTEVRRSAADGWELLTRLALDRGLYKERAEEFARQALRLNPSPGNFENLALACAGAGKAAEAEKVLAQGLERHPGHPQLRAGLEALRAKSGAGR